MKVWQLVTIAILIAVVFYGIGGGFKKKIVISTGS